MYASRQPTPDDIAAVRSAFDADRLVDICQTDDFTRWADRFELRPHADGSERFYWHRDNGSSVLAVAHLDTVQDDRTCQVVDTASGLLAVSGGLDDRLGAYVILELLPALGITCDILLTTDEEIGGSTARDFVPSKEYDWMIEFDRGGTDVVAYQYDSKELGEMVEDAGARMGQGSYSDICELEHLGCVGLNWGVGYQDYHSPRAHAWLDDTFRMLARFQRFHRANEGYYLPHDPMPVDTSAWLDSEIVADCGDLIDLADELSYVETDGGFLLCYLCGHDQS
jgi:hypothetical protein